MIILICSLFVLPVLDPVVFEHFVVLLDFAHLLVQLRPSLVQFLHLLAVIVLVKDDLELVLGQGVLAEVHLLARLPALGRREQRVHAQPN